MELHNIDYFIFSAADNQDWPDANYTYLDSLPLVQKCNTNNNILFRDFSLKEFTEKNNLNSSKTFHLDSTGHQLFAKWLIQRLQLTKASA